MQRFLSAVVILSIGALMSARAAAQSPPAVSATPVAPPSAQPKAPAAAAPGAGTGPAAKPKPARPVAADSPPNNKPNDRLSDEAELSRVVGLYEAGKYRECSSEMERLLDPLGKAPLRQPG